MSRATAANLATSKTVFGVAQANAGGGAVNVRVAGEVAEDDITSLGAGDSRIIATDINAASDALQCRLIRVDRPDGSEHVVGTCDENGHLSVQPHASRETSSLHVFNPRSYGARFDGVTDDLPALQAMHDAIPAETGGIVQLPIDGIAWLSDTWRISKPIQLRGAGGNGGAGDLQCGFEVAPGRTAIRLDKSTLSLDGHDASLHVVERFDVKSRLLVHDDAGDTLGMGIDRTFVDSAAFRKGDCYIALGGLYPGVFFRATAAGSFGGAEPAWNTTIGAVTAGVWVTEAFPTLRVDNQAYALGERVFLEDDNRYFFECVVAGTSADPTPVALRGGDGAHNLMIGGTVDDGTVTWEVKLAAGLYVNCNNGIVERIFARGFTGAGFHIQAGVDMDVEGSPTYADNFRARDLTVDYCGLGMFIGGETNGFTVNALWTLHTGYFIPSTAAPGEGGHTLHDHSDGGGLVTDLYSQTGTGRAVFKNGTGLTTYVSCTSEAPRQDNFGSTTDELGATLVTGYSTVVGGNLVPDETLVQNVWLVGAYIGGRGLSETDSHGTKTLRARFSFQDGVTVFPFSSSDENGNFFAWQYEYQQPTGWWGFVYGNQGFKTSIGLSGRAAGFDPCPGWFTFYDGYLLGRPGTETPLVDGSMPTLTSQVLREGRRRKGDRFRDGMLTLSIASDTYGVAEDPCFRGMPWLPGIAPGTPRAYDASEATWTIPASVVEPTANGTLPDAGRKVFKCIRGHTVEWNDPEPDWASAANVGDEIGYPDAALDAPTWRLVGYTPDVLVGNTPRGGETGGLDVTAADYTMTRTELAPEIVKVSGTVPAATTRSLVLPLPATDDAAYTRVVRNTATAGGGGASLVVKTTADAGQTIAFGMTAVIGVDSSGTFRVTADV